MQYLNVPFPEKDAAKSLGAKFDPQTKRWFVPDGIDTTPFKLWFPVVPNIELIAPIFLVTSADHCYRCKSLSIVHCLGSQSLFDLDDQQIVEGDSIVMISNISLDDRTLAKEIAKIAPLYRVDFSQTQDEHVYMNHCDKCGAKLGDFFLHCEPGGAFFPSENLNYDTLHKTLIADSGRYPCNGSFRYPH